MHAARHIDVGGHTLRTAVCGAGTPTFVCLHGLADTLDVWSTVTPGLAQRGQVILLDQRAHGDSGVPPGPYRREDLAADVCAVMDGLEVPRALLIGHSMGGVVAMTTALCFPERVAGLVLLGTASECSERVSNWYEKMACAAESDGLEGLRRLIFSPYAQRVIRGDPQGLAHMTRCLKSLYHDPLTLQLATIRCPVLLLVGDKDPMGAGASVIIQRQIAGAHLEIVPDRGHWIHVDAPEVLLAGIDRYFDGRELQ